MAQWVNRLRNNIFVNPPPLPLLCEISGALHLAQPGLTTGRLSVRPADEMQVNFEILKVGCIGRNIRLVASLPRYSIILALPMHSSRFFRVKPIARLIFKARHIYIKREGKKKQTVRDEQVSYLHVAPL